MKRYNKLCIYCENYLYNFQRGGENPSQLDFNEFEVVWNDLEERY